MVESSQSQWCQLLSPASALRALSSSTAARARTPQEPGSQLTPAAPCLPAALRGNAELTPLHYCCLLSTACACLLQLPALCSPAQCQTLLPPLGASLISKQKAICWPESPGRAELGSGSSLHLEQFNTSVGRGWGINFGCCCFSLGPHLRARACCAQRCAASLLPLLSLLLEFPCPAFITL